MQGQDQLEEQQLDRVLIQLTSNNDQKFAQFRAKYKKHHFRAFYHH